MHTNIKHAQTLGVPTTVPKTKIDPKTKMENSSEFPPKYQRMLKMGIPRKAVLQKMVLDGVRGPSKKKGGGVTAESLRKMRKIAKSNGIRPRKTKLPEKKQQNSGSGPLRVTPDILANARANLRKGTTRKRKAKKSSTSSSNPLGITVDILKNMRSGLRRTWFILITSLKSYEYQYTTHSYHYTLKNYEYRLYYSPYRRMLRNT